MQCAVEPVLEPGSVIHSTPFSKPQDLRKSLLAKSAALYMKVDTHAQGGAVDWLAL